MMLECSHEQRLFPNILTLVVFKMIELSFPFFLKLRRQRYLLIVVCMHIKRQYLDQFSNTRVFQYSQNNFWENETVTITFTEQQVY